MQRVSQLALCRLLSPPSATAAVRRTALVAAEAVSGGGGVLLPRGGVAGVHLGSPLRFWGFWVPSMLAELCAPMTLAISH